VIQCNNEGLKNPFIFHSISTISKNLKKYIWLIVTILQDIPFTLDNANKQNRQITLIQSNMEENNPRGKVINNHAIKLDSNVSGK